MNKRVNWLHLDQVDQTLLTLAQLSPHLIAYYDGNASDLDVTRVYTSHAVSVIAAPGQVWPTN